MHDFRQLARRVLDPGHATPADRTVAANTPAAGGGTGGIAAAARCAIRGSRREITARIIVKPVGLKDWTRKAHLLPKV